MTRIAALLLLCVACASPGASPREPDDGRAFTLELEGGALTQSRNDVRIPGNGGTRFALDELVADDPYVTWRVTGDWELDERHALRAVIAPIELDGAGRLQQQTTFAGATFAADTDTQGTYKFNSYRIGYRYTFLNEERWRLRVGGTLFVRDAQVELVQGAIRASDDNVGLVPLVNFAAEYRPSESWRVVAELDGLASPQGRAVDFLLKGQYDVSDVCSVSLGYRTIEGGADNDDVFSFAWLNSVVASVAFRL